MTPDMLDWLRQLVPQLRRIESDILAWLEGVCDFRYALAQYQSQVTHLDHHVGTLVAALQERCLYDQTLIVFTSPHGEILTKVGLPFHHHALVEDVLRVPLILKPAAGDPGPKPAAGQCMDGVCDLMDLFPTLLESLDLPNENDLTGSSRWRHLVDGSAIPARSSLAVDSGGGMFALAGPSHVFLQCEALTYLSSEWWWNRGDRGLFFLRSPMDYSENLVDRLPRIAQEMERSLAAWQCRLRGQQPSGTWAKAA